MAQTYEPQKIRIVLGPRAGRTEKFAAKELAQEIRSVAGKRPVIVTEKKLDRRTAAGKLLFILGTRESSDLVADMISQRKCTPPSSEQGYALKTLPNPLAARGAAIVVAGTDERGVLYGVRDLQNYYLQHEKGRIIAARLNTRSYPRITKRGTASWDYYVTDPFGYVDQLSRFKLNVASPCPWRYIFDHYGIIEYARERGVEIMWWDGLYSYHYVGFGNHNQWAILPEPAPPDIKRDPQGRCLCPSDPKTIPWMTNYALEVIEKLPGITGVGFQTGNLDKHECHCEKCSKYTPAEYFTMEINPVIGAIADKYPEMDIAFGLGCHLTRTPDYMRWIPRVDNRAVLAVENRYPIPDRAMMDHLDKLIPGRYMLTAKLYGSRGQLAGWRERRTEMSQDLFDNVAEAVRHGVTHISSLNQTPLYHNRPLYITNLYGETLWHGGAPPAKHLKRLREICDLDQRVSDPPTQFAKEKHKFWVIKYPYGTKEDVWVPWPGVVKNAQNICDLLSGEESATYRFRMPAGWRKRLRSAELVIKGAKDDVKNLDSKYEFDITINGHAKRRLKCPWNKGGDVHNSVYDNATDWRIPVPVNWLDNSTDLTIHFRDANGMVMYDRIAFELTYDEP